MTEREKHLQYELEQSRIENKILREKVDALVRMIYGKKSEQIDPDQQTLFGELDSKKAEAPAQENAASEQGAKTDTPARTQPKKEKKPRLPEHLPIVEEVLEPAEVAADPSNWRLIGEEVTERLDYTPAEFSKHRLIRRKYVRCDLPFNPPVVAALPATMQERCLATPALISQVVISKYLDHLPLYRQEQIYQMRHSVHIPRQTLSRWVALAADTLEPLYKLMSQGQQEHPYLQIDETPIAYLTPGKGQTAKGYLWVSNVPGGDVIYHWHTGRGTACLDALLSENYAGTLQSDGYQAYSSLQKQRARTGTSSIQLAGCWAHARRKFYEAHESGSQSRISAWFIHQIKHLYAIETRLRMARAGPKLRETIRCVEAQAILQRIRNALFKMKPHCLPKSLLGKAIQYTLDQWEGLCVYAKNGLIEIDNNLVENAIRPTKLGAKNWLFIGNDTSGANTAILYSILESAKRHGLEPSSYLRHLLEALPKTTNWQLHKLTPMNYAKSLQQKAA